MKKLVLAAALLGALMSSASAQQAGNNSVIQTHSPQDANFPVNRDSCTEWDRCESIPGFHYNNGQGYNWGGGGNIYGPVENYYTPDFIPPQGGFTFTHSHQSPF